MFESAKELSVIDRGVSDDFLKECRSAGVVQMLVNDADEEIHSFTVKGVIDFCLGPALPGREKLKRRISYLWFSALDIFSQVLQVCLAIDLPGPFVLLMENAVLIGFI